MISSLQPQGQHYTNAAAIFFENAKKFPERLALVIPQMEGSSCKGEERITYAELLRKVSFYQQGWQRLGYKRGDRVVLLMRPSIELYASVISLFSIGVIPVFIDTGMSRDKIEMALEDSKARAIIGVRKLLQFFWLFPALRRMERYCVEGAGIGYRDVREIVAGISEFIPPHAVVCTQWDHGLISFTSGSTGRPKGADRTHFSLLEQHYALSDHWPEIPEEIDCNCFPVMVLHNLCCGITTVMPRLDLAAPASVNPELIAGQLENGGITRFSGAPAFMASVCRYAEENNLFFPVVRDVMSGGATVPMALVHSMHRVFPNAKLHVLYGSTEAEPIGSADYEELIKLDGTRPGYLVGKPAHFVEMKIFNIDGYPESEEELFRCEAPQGQRGEICVSGPHVLASYVDNPAATRENKIPRKNGGVWHRTGDTGYLDSEGRLWLTGRIKDTLKVGERTIDPFSLEKCLDEMPGISRSALIQDGSGVVLVLQANNLLSLESITALLHSEGLSGIPIYEIGLMPVDGRHNSKVDRPKLRDMLQKGKLPLLGKKIESRPAASSPDSTFIVSLNKVDYVTLTSVVTTSIAGACAINGKVYAAVSLLFLAMIADAVDGMLARKWGLERNFGRYLDGFMDVLIYLVTPALVMYQWGFNGIYGAFIIAFVAAGCTRLAVFNEIGNIEEEGSLSYLGMPVFWSVLILAVSMISSLLIPIELSRVLLAIALSVFSFLMIYRRPFFKFKSLLQILSVTLGGAFFFAAWQLNGGDHWGGVKYFWIAFYLNLPVIFGGVLHMLVVTKDVLSVLKIPLNEKLFGANKTWRGVLLVPLLTMSGMIMLYPLELIQQSIWGWSVLEGHNLILLGLACGFAYVIAELPNSFIKRRLGIGPGQTPEKHRWLFILMDQLDSIIGVAIVYCVVLGYDGWMFLLLIAQAIFVALTVKRLLFMAKLKKAPN